MHRRLVIAARADDRAGTTKSGAIRKIAPLMTT
jgi:hypothetical protein